MRNFLGPQVFSSTLPKMNREYGGYAYLLDIAAPGTVVIPSRYSFAKYKDKNLVSFKGDYPYPTLMSGEIQDAVSNGTSQMVLNGYQHFLNDVEKCLFSCRGGLQSFFFGKREFWLRECLEVRLAIGRYGHPVQRHEDGRHHIVCEALAHLLLEDRR